MGIDRPKLNQDPRELGTVPPGDLSPVTAVMNEVIIGAALGNDRQGVDDTRNDRQILLTAGEGGNKLGSVANENPLRSYKPDNSFARHVLNGIPEQIEMRGGKGLFGLGREKSPKKISRYIDLEERLSLVMAKLPVMEFGNVENRERFEDLLLQTLSTIEQADESVFNEKGEISPLGIIQLTVGVTEFIQNNANIHGKEYIENLIELNQVLEHYRTKFLNPEDTEGVPRELASLILETGQNVRLALSVLGISPDIEIDKLIGTIIELRESTKDIPIGNIEGIGETVSEANLGLQAKNFLPTGVETNKILADEGIDLPVPLIHEIANISIAGGRLSPNQSRAVGRYIRQHKVTPEVALLEAREEAIATLKRINDIEMSAIKAGKLSREEATTQEVLFLDEAERKRLMYAHLRFIGIDVKTLTDKERRRQLLVANGARLAFTVAGAVIGAMGGVEAIRDMYPDGILAEGPELGHLWEVYHNATSGYGEIPDDEIPDLMDNPGDFQAALEALASGPGEDVDPDDSEVGLADFPDDRSGSTLDDHTGQGGVGRPVGGAAYIDDSPETSELGTGPDTDEVPGSPDQEDSDPTPEIARPGVQLTEEQMERFSNTNGTFFEIKYGETVSHGLAAAGLDGGDMYGEDGESGVWKDLQTNSVAIHTDKDGHSRAFVMVYDDPNSSDRIFNVINPDPSLHGTPAGARLVVIHLPDNYSPSQDELVANVSDPLREVLETSSIDQNANPSDESTQLEAIIDSARHAVIVAIESNEIAESVGNYSVDEPIEYSIPVKGSTEQAIYKAITDRDLPTDVDPTEVLGDYNDERGTYERPLPDGTTLIVKPSDLNSDGRADTVVTIKVYDQDRQSDGTFSDEIYQKLNPQTSSEDGEPPLEQPTPNPSDGATSQPPAGQDPTSPPPAPPGEEKSEATETIPPEETAEEQQSPAPEVESTTTPGVTTVPEESAVAPPAESPTSEPTTEITPEPTESSTDEPPVTSSPEIPTTPSPGADVTPPPPTVTPTTEPKAITPTETAESSPSPVPTDSDTTPPLDATTSPESTAPPISITPTQTVGAETSPPVTGTTDSGVAPSATPPAVGSTTLDDSTSTTEPAIPEASASPTTDTSVGSQTSTPAATPPADEPDVETAEGDSKAMPTVEGGVEIDATAESPGGLDSQETTDGGKNLRAWIVEYVKEHPNSRWVPPTIAGALLFAVGIYALYKDGLLPSWKGSKEKIEKALEGQGSQGSVSLKNRYLLEIAALRDLATADIVKALLGKPIDVEGEQINVIINGELRTFRRDSLPTSIQIGVGGEFDINDPDTMLWIMSVHTDGAIIDEAFVVPDLNSNLFVIGSFMDSVMALDGERHRVKYIDNMIRQGYFSYGIPQSIVQKVRFRFGNHLLGNTYDTNVRWIAEAIENKLKEGTLKYREVSILELSDGRKIHQLELYDVEQESEAAVVPSDVQEQTTGVNARYLTYTSEELSDYSIPQRVSAAMRNIFVDQDGQLYTATTGESLSRYNLPSRKNNAGFKKIRADLQNDTLLASLVNRGFFDRKFNGILTRHTSEDTLRSSVEKQVQDELYKGLIKSGVISPTLPEELLHDISLEASLEELRDTILPGILNNALKNGSYEIRARLIPGTEQLGGVWEGVLEKTDVVQEEDALTGEQAVPLVSVPQYPHLETNREFLDKTLPLLTQGSLSEPTLEDISESLRNGEINFDNFVEGYKSLIAREEFDEASLLGLQNYVENVKNLGLVEGRFDTESDLDEGRDVNADLHVLSSAKTMASKQHPDWNEDGSWLHKSPNGLTYAAVLDGVGSQGTLVAQEAVRILETRQDSLDTDDLSLIVSRLDADLRGISEMGSSTLTLMRHKGNILQVANVGDSLLILVDPNQNPPRYRVVTRGHTWARYFLRGSVQNLTSRDAQEMDMLLLDGPENEINKKIAQINEAMGGSTDYGHVIKDQIGSSINDRQRGNTTYQLDACEKQVKSGEVALLISDGIIKNMTLTELVLAIAAGMNAEGIVELAYRRSGIPGEQLRSGVDDITAVMLEFSDGSSQSGDQNKEVAEAVIVETAQEARSGEVHGDEQRDYPIVVEVSELENITEHEILLTLENQIALLTGVLIFKTGEGKYYELEIGGTVREIPGIKDGNTPPELEGISPEMVAMLKAKGYIGWTSDDLHDDYRKDPEKILTEVESRLSLDIFTSITLGLFSPDIPSDLKDEIPTDTRVEHLGPEIMKIIKKARTKGTHRLEPRLIEDTQFYEIVVVKNKDDATLILAYVEGPEEPMAEAPVGADVTPRYVFEKTSEDIMDYPMAIRLAALRDNLFKTSDGEFQYYANPQSMFSRHTPYVQKESLARWLQDMPDELYRMLENRAYFDSRTGFIWSHLITAEHLKSQIERYHREGDVDILLDNNSFSLHFPDEFIEQIPDDTPQNELREVLSKKLIEGIKGEKYKLVTRIIPGTKEYVIEGDGAYEIVLVKNDEVGTDKTPDQKQMLPFKDLPKEEKIRHVLGRPLMTGGKIGSVAWYSDVEVPTGTREAGLEPINQVEMSEITPQQRAILLSGGTIPGNEDREFLALKTDLTDGNLKPVQIRLPDGFVKYNGETIINPGTQRLLAITSALTDNERDAKVSELVRDIMKSDDYLGLLRLLYDCGAFYLEDSIPTEIIERFMSPRENEGGEPTYDAESHRFAEFLFDLIKEGEYKVELNPYSIGPYGEATINMARIVKVEEEIIAEGDADRSTNVTIEELTEQLKNIPNRTVSLYDLLSTTTGGQRPPSVIKSTWQPKRPDISRLQVISPEKLRSNHPKLLAILKDKEISYRRVQLAGRGAEGTVYIVEGDEHLAIKVLFEMNRPISMNETRMLWAKFEEAEKDAPYTLAEHRYLVERKPSPQGSVIMEVLDLPIIDPTDDSFLENHGISVIFQLAHFNYLLRQSEAFNPDTKFENFLIDDEGLLRVLDITSFLPFDGENLSLLQQELLGIRLLDKIFPQSNILLFAEGMYKETVNVEVEKLSNNQRYDMHEAMISREFQKLPTSVRHYILFSRGVINIPGIERYSKEWYQHKLVLASGIVDTLQPTEIPTQVRDLVARIKQNEKIPSSSEDLISTYTVQDFPLEKIDLGSKQYDVLFTLAFSDFGTYHNTIIGLGIPLLSFGAGISEFMTHTGWALFPLPVNGIDEWLLNIIRGDIAQRDVSVDTYMEGLLSRLNFDEGDPHYVEGKAKELLIRNMLKFRNYLKQTYIPIVSQKLKDVDPHITDEELLYALKNNSLIPAGSARGRFLSTISEFMNKTKFASQTPIWADLEPVLREEMENMARDICIELGIPSMIWGESSSAETTDKEPQQGLP